MAFPLHLAMPVFVDSYYFDQCAQALLHHGRFYRDVFCQVFPGMVWIQAAIRGLLGWRSEAIRLVDFLIVSAIIWLLASKMRPYVDQRVSSAWSALVLFFCYFATGEWCHCQPDVWMLLPALTALALRAASLRDERPDMGRSSLQLLLEGACWGLAFVIKPLIVASALACWAVTALIAWRSGNLRRLAAEASLVIAGFTVVVVVAILWLMLSGDGPFLLEAYRGHFNHEYYRLSRGWLDRSIAMLAWCLPWSLIHLAAVPIACATLWSTRSASRIDASFPLLAAFYLAWLVQANYIQRQLPYHLVAPLLLALTIVLSRLRGMRRPLGVAFAGLVVVAALPHPQLMADLRTWKVRPHPLLDVDRLAVWGRCWTEGSSATMRDRLSLEPTGTHWRELAHVEGFLRSQALRDRELTCYSLSSVSLYSRLGIAASTRWVFLWSACAFFPRHSASILREVAASPQRFVVTDIRDVDPDRALDPVLDPPLPDVFPWREPVVFRCGLYRVHRVTRAHVESAR